MGEPKKDSPEVVNLREREKVLTEKIASLEKIDANHQLQHGIDVREVKQRTQKQLAEVRSAIEKESK